MPIQKYDFTTGIETAAAPTTSVAAAIGDVLILGLQTQFTIADAQGSAANVTNVLYSKATYRAVFIQVTIYRSASGGSTRTQTGVLMMVNDGTNWEVSWMSSVSVPASDDAGVDFTVTSSGQLQYVSDANGGSYSSSTSWLKWKVIDLVAA